MAVDEQRSGDDATALEQALRVARRRRRVRLLVGLAAVAVAVGAVAGVIVVVA
jgi:hypothetical protein